MQFIDQIMRLMLSVRRFQVMINLIDQKGAEHALGSQLARCLEMIANPQVRYEPFDFHKECKGMRYDRLQLLIDRVASAQDAYGFYFEKRKFSWRARWFNNSIGLR